MRKALLATAAVAIMSAAGLAGTANALTPSGQSGVRQAIDQANPNLVQNVRYVCTYGYYGRRCWWEPGYRRYYRYRHW
jgi:hypothetical protein